MGIEVSSSLYQLLPAPENRVGTKKPVSEHSRNILLRRPASRRAPGPLVGDALRKQGRDSAGLRRELSSPHKRRVMRTPGREKTRAVRGGDIPLRLSRVSGTGRTGLSGKFYV